MRPSFSFPLRAACRTSFVLVLAVGFVAGACSGKDDAATPSSEPAAATVASAVPVTEPVTAAPEPTSPPTTVPDVVDFYDATTVHEMTIEFDPAEYDVMIEAFKADNSKSWITADLTIDGEDYRQVGMRLKGNSSLFAIGGRIPGFGAPPRGAPPGGAAPPAAQPVPAAPTDSIAPTDSTPAVPGGPPGDGGPPPGSFGDTTADKPESLPWLIRLDKNIEDQNHQGRTDFVIRSNTSKSALNEVVALELLDEAGLETQLASPVRLTINGGDARLRLVIENPNDSWMAANFSASGRLFKADNSGNYDYLGADPKAYKDAFKQEAGEDDMRQLVDFLDFVNNSSDEDFAAELADHLDVESFARYVAMESKVLDNFDNIDGPGNNSYLYFDNDSDKATVVAWDHNLALGVSPFGNGAGAPPFDPASMPKDFPIKFSDNNILYVRFNKTPSFAALVAQAEQDLYAELFDSGVAGEILDRRVAVLSEQATDLVPAETLTAEADSIRGFFKAA
jgi:spore coat protein CotH